MNMSCHESVMYAMQAATEDLLLGIPDGSPAKSTPGEAVALDNDFSDRMTRQQAEQAKRSFEFPGWVCLGIMDMTASEGGWGLIIAPMSEIDDFYVYVSWRLWIQEWQLECYYRARDRAYMDELAVQPDANPIEFKKRNQPEHPYPSRMTPGGRPIPAD
jgi:hypothetical protein